MPLFLELFHGRSPANAELDDWGTQGPVFKVSSKWIHTTYATHIRFQTEEHDDCELVIIDDMVYYDGVWYGDWTVCLASQGDENLEELKERLVKYDPAKAHLPPQNRQQPQPA